MSEVSFKYMLWPFGPQPENDLIVHGRFDAKLYHVLLFPWYILLLNVSYQFKLLKQVILKWVSGLSFDYSLREKLRLSLKGIRLATKRFHIKLIRLTRMETYMKLIRESLTPITYSLITIILFAFYFIFLRIQPEDVTPLVFSSGIEVEAVVPPGKSVVTELVTITETDPTLSNVDVSKVPVKTPEEIKVPVVPVKVPVKIVPIIPPVVKSKLGTNDPLLIKEVSKGYSKKRIKSIFETLGV